MSKKDTDLSAELRRLVRGNPDLRATLVRGFEGQLGEGCSQCNNGKSSYWYGKSLDDFYPFIKKWQTHVPNVGKDKETGEDLLGLYNAWFADFVTSPEGYLAVQHPLFRSWFIDFQNARKAFLETKRSAANVAAIIKAKKIKEGDYIKPAGGWRSFVDFFARQLKPEARKWANIDDQCVLNSHVDATFAPGSSVLPDFPDVKSLPAKGDILSVREVFNNHPFASRFLGGTALTFWLEYNNAHWFYIPIDGVIVGSDVVAGLYGMEYAYRNLPAHKRGYVIIETEEFGLIGLLFVGLQTVSEVDFFVRPGDRVRKGQALGHFNYGGSTSILFFEKGKAVPAINVSKVTNGEGVKVRIGQKLLTTTKKTGRKKR